MPSYLPLIAVLTSLIFAAFILIVDRYRATLAFSWLLASLGGILTWLLIFISARMMPAHIPLGNWRLESFSIDSPRLLLDTASWPFALALTTLGLAVVLTDALHSGEFEPMVWAGNLALIALGLLAVLAGNPSTLALAWAAIDGVEVFLLLGTLQRSSEREQVIAVFSARLTGIFLLLMAEILAHARGMKLIFEDIPTVVSLYLFLASALRLGVVPLHMPFWKDASLRRGLGLTARMVPVVSSAILLVRTAQVGLPASQGFYLMIFTVIAALYGGFSWISAKDELDGRPHWILGMTALSLAAGVGGKWADSLHWSMVLVLSGAVLFLFSASSKYLRFLPVVGVAFCSGVPWAFIGYHAQTGGEMSGFWSFPLVVSHALLLAGYLRHAFRPRSNQVYGERWAWVIYGGGLSLLLLAYLVYLWWWYTFIRAATIQAGPEQIIYWALLGGLTAAFFMVTTRRSRVLDALGRFLHPLFSLVWLYRLLWRLYYGLERATRFITQILEGEGGVLWAFLLLTLLLVYLSRSELK
jgi:hypothetical protein